jgi:hypothetical protein
MLAVSAWTVTGFGAYTPYGWLHDPAGRGGGGAGSPPPGATPTLSIGDVSVLEGAAKTTTTAVLTVTLSAPARQRVKVHWQTSDGTAVAGSDYRSRNGSLTLQPGVTTQQIAVVVRGDAVREPDETFTVTLDAPVGATLADAQGVGTIRNDD